MADAVHLKPNPRVQSLKRPYTKPKLIELGSLRQIALAASSTLTASLAQAANTDFSDDMQAIRLTAVRRR
jgi:hypothetical protein